MKEGWEYKKLGDICDILNGFAFKSSKYVEKGIRVIRITNVQKGQVEDNDPKFYPFSSQKEIERYLLYEGDLLVSLTGNVGRVGSLPKELLPAALNQRVACLRVKEKHVIRSYLYYFLNSDYFENLCIKHSRGAAQLNLSTIWLSNYEIPVPPLAEQREIVAYLDTAFAKIDAVKANAEQALNEVKALFQASLKKMLEPKEGWEYVKIGNIFNTYSGGTPLKSQKDYYEGGTIPWLRSGEVCAKYITKTGLFITQKGLDNSSAKYFPSNTVVIAMYGATAAQVGILKLNATSNQAVCGLLPNEKYVSEFVYYWFTYKQKELASQAQGGAQPNISQIKIRNVLIPAISKVEQRTIVATLDALKSKVDQLQANCDKITNECAALKQAILRQVFE